MTNPTPPGKLIVSVDLQQRSNYLMKYSTLELWMDSSFGEDGKQTNPTLAKVLSVGHGVDEKLIGQWALCHYNTFTSFVTDNYRYGSHEQKNEEGLSLFTIYPNQVKALLDEEGMPVPYDGYLLAKRIPVEQQSTLIIPESAFRHDMLWFEVDRTTGDVPYKKGDMVLCYRYSDLAINYTINKKPVECFVIKQDDVHGFVNKQ